ncbi:hypothetical protein FJV80_17395 [Mesorhizobium sp. WSM4310]|uniref:hypothetical protein n=1 Tax=Mesorhizobium sp. WSM4310 TaxID=2589883 RepID=UPI00115ECFF8|nr:hypothetical protein [Mesorhizobium sp. WSM4310]TRC84426.1 hypothetical protein FJV80_17395 [Mesorhizobium sp. WSM4310]
MSNLAGSDVVRQSAALRGKGEFQKAIDLVKGNIGSFDETIRLSGWLECFYAAKEMGDTVQARSFAQECAKEDPDIPSIQSYL